MHAIANIGQQSVGMMRSPMDDNEAVGMMRSPMDDNEAVGMRRSPMDDNEVKKINKIQWECRN